MMKKMSISSLSLMVTALLVATPAKPVHAAPPVVRPVQENTLLNSQLSPSPDPTSLTYGLNKGTFITSDGDVNEMPNRFATKNLLVSTLSGQLLNPFTTTTMPTEIHPQGIHEAAS